MKKIFFILMATVVAMITPAAAGAQEEAKTLYILKGGEVVYNSPVSEIDSIIFYEPESIEIPGITVNSSLPVGELTFMAYNLGANSDYDTPEEQTGYTPTGNTDATVYGGLFQWGRPADGHELRTSATTRELATSDIPGHSNFIETTGQPDSWTTLENTTNLWGVPKTANDPCPEGWRIPTVEEWQSIYGDASGNTVEWNDSGTKGLKVSPTGGTATLFLPAAGSRNVMGDFSTVGRRGDYVTTTMASRFYMLSNTLGGISTGNVLANGNPVRCVKEY